MGKFSKIYVIHSFSKFLGNITCFFWNLSIFTGKNIFTLKWGIFRNNGWWKFPNNGWGKFDKKYVINLFSWFSGNIPCFLWNLSIFLVKNSQFLGEKNVYLKFGIFHKIYVIHWFSTYLGNILCFFGLYPFFWGRVYLPWNLEFSPIMYGEIL